MNLGHGHRRSVVILWTWTAVLSGFVLYPTLTGSNPTYLPFAMAALAIVLYTILHPSVRARRREDIEAAYAALREDIARTITPEVEAVAATLRSHGFPYRTLEEFLSNTDWIVVALKRRDRRNNVGYSSSHEEAHGHRLSGTNRERG
jgi:hypothetical protein